VKVRFQADADLNHIIVLAVQRREPAVDFQTAVAARLSSQDDMSVLSLAAREGRVLVSHDHRTMPRHFAERIAAEPSPGLIIVLQHLQPAAVAEDLLLIWQATDAEEWVNRICYLPL
jgi:uncharacterized protein DUF5615